MNSCTMPMIFLILLCATVALASITGTISGIVTDPAGALISGADVSATNVLTGVVHTVKTDAKGFYSFLALPIGTYTISVHYEGFKDFQQKQIVIDANSALNSPWCKELDFDTANGVGGFVDSLSIPRGISRFDLCRADSDLPGVNAGNKLAKEAGPRGCSIPAACPPPSACAGSGSG